MGSEREDEFDRDRDEDRGQDAVERVREPSPFQVANLHPMPRTEGRVLTRPLEHAAYRAGHRQADEEPVNWSTYVVATDPGPRLAEVELAPGQEPEAPNRNQDRLDPEFRERSWNAYTATSLRLEVHYKDLGVDFTEFMNAQEDQDLQTLGFVKPRGRWGTASAFADQQKLVDDVRLGSLFRANGVLSLTRADSAALATAQRAFDAHGTAKEEHDATIGQDHALLGAKDQFDAALSAMRGSFDSLDAARVHVEAVKLQHEVQEDRQALDALRSQAEDVKSFLELTFGGALKYMVTGPEELADSVEALGVMASYAVNMVPQHSIREAELRLERDTANLRSAEGEEARLLYKAARHQALAAVARVSSARQALLSAMNSRHKVYLAAGNASARASGADGVTQAKIASMIAAMPIVETVLGILHKMVTKTAAAQAAYTEEAGVGFGMALYARRAPTATFVSTLGHLAYLRDMFADATLEWWGRLASLQRVRTQLGGERAATR